MPIPPTAAPTGITLHSLSGGRWEAQCGGCMAYSAPVAAVDAAGAWVELQQLGWEHFRHPTWGGSGYAVCPACVRGGPAKVAKRKRR